MLKSFRELEVWQRAHTLALDIYRATERFPDRERFGVVSQIRRAAVSIPANIAEGFGRRGTKELLQHLAIANGSLEETRYFLLLSSDLNYLAVEDRRKIEERCDVVARMLNALSQSLRNGAAARARTGSPGGPTRSKPARGATR